MTPITQKRKTKTVGDVGHQRVTKSVFYTTSLYVQVYFGKCMFCYFMNIRALSYYENDVHKLCFQDLSEPRILLIIL